MHNAQIVDVVKTLKKTELVFGNGGTLTVGKSDIKITPVNGGDELLENHHTAWMVGISVLPLNNIVLKADYSNDTVELNSDKTDYFNGRNAIHGVDDQCSPGIRGNRPVPDGFAGYRGP